MASSAKSKCQQAADLLLVYLPCMSVTIHRTPNYTSESVLVINLALYLIGTADTTGSAYPYLPICSYRTALVKRLLLLLRYPVLNHNHWNCLIYKSIHKCCSTQICYCSSLLLVINLLLWPVPTDWYRSVRISIFHGLAKLTEGETKCNVFVGDHMVIVAYCRQSKLRA